MTPTNKEVAVVAVVVIPALMRYETQQKYSLFTSQCADQAIGVCIRTTRLRISLWF
jgi:hypothetical protein